MKIYQVGETVTCKVTVLRSGALYNPITSVLIYIYIEGTSTLLVNGVAMYNESTGIFTYDFQTPSCIADKYCWYCKVTDGVKIGIKYDTFKLEA